MTFDRISFNHFFLEVKDIIEPRFLPFINPETQMFFKSGSVYFAMTFDTGSAYLAMMIGKDKATNIEGMRNLIKQLRDGKIRFLRFGTYSKNKRMLALFRYIQATQLREVEKYYKDGDSLIEFELDLDAIDRL
jgi:hypothetical protein